MKEVNKRIPVNKKLLFSNVELSAQLRDASAVRHHALRLKPLKFSRDSFIATMEGLCIEWHEFQKPVEYVEGSKTKVFIHGVFDLKDLPLNFLV